MDLAKTEQMQSRIKQRETTGAIPVEQLSSRDLDQIKEKIGSRVAYYSKIMGVTVGRITIRNQKPVGEVVVPRAI